MKKIKFPNYKSYAIILCLLSIVLGVNSCKKTNKSNQEEWISIFNGENLDGWDIKMSGYELNENYKNTFLVQDSILRISYDNYEVFDGEYGHLYYQTPYSYYKLKFDYRFTGEQMQGGIYWNERNSGIMLHSQSAASNELNQDFPISIELQLLGGLSNGKNRTTGNVCTPGTVVVMGDTINTNHCINSNSKTYNGDQWIHGEAIVYGGEFMQFIIEKDTVLTFQNPQIGDNFKLKKYHGEAWKNWGIVRDEASWKSKAGEILTEGYISLQAESHPIDFKNIELLDLCGCMDPKAKNYKSYFVKNDNSKCKY